MPVIKSAKKKLRKDNRRQKVHAVLKKRLLGLIKKAKKHPTEKTVQEAQSAIDKAAKKHLIHKNKAARITSALLRLLTGKKTTKSKPKKAAKK